VHAMDRGGDVWMAEAPRVERGGRGLSYETSMNIERHDPVTSVRQLKPQRPRQRRGR
jgi:hypothetical protein